MTGRGGPYVPVETWLATSLGCVATLELDAQAFGHLVIEKTFARTIRLDPFAINDKLWDGTQTGVLDNFLSGAGRFFNVYIFERNIVLGEKAFRYAAVGTPEGGIDRQIHSFI